MSKTVARINADGSLLIRGRVFKLVYNYSDKDNVDEEYILDENTEVDEEINPYKLLNILLDIKSNSTSPDCVSLDSDGNLLINEIIEGLSFSLTSRYEITTNEVHEEVNL